MKTFNRFQMLDTWLIETYGYRFRVFYIPDSFVVRNGQVCPLTARSVIVGLN